MTIKDTADRIVSALFDQAESDGGLVRDKLLMRVCEVMSEAASAKEHDAPKPPQTVNGTETLMGGLRAISEAAKNTVPFDERIAQIMLSKSMQREETLRRQRAAEIEIRRSLVEAGVQMDAKAELSGCAILSNMNNADLVRVGTSTTEHGQHNFAHGLLSASSVTMPADMSDAIAAATAKRKCSTPG